MKSFIVQLFFFLIPPMILMAPHVGVLAYYWFTLMTPNNFLYGWINIPWLQIIALVTVVTWMFSKENKSIPVNFLSVSLLTFFLWTCVTTITARYPAAAQEQLFDNTKILLMVVVTAALFQNRNRIHELIWLYVLAAGFHTTWEGLRTLASGGRHQASGPLASLFTGENSLARIAFLLLPLFFFLYQHSQSRLTRWGLLGSAFLTLLCLLGTGSRGGFLAFAAMMALYWWRAGLKIRYAVLALMIGGIVYSLLPEERIDRYATLENATEQISAYQRFDAWKYNINIANNSPILGGGYNVYLGYIVDAGDWSFARPAHSNYFQVLGEHGYVGLGLYLIFCLSMYWTTVWVRKKTAGRPDMKYEYDLALMLQLCFVGYFVGGLTITHAYWEPIYTLIGLSLAMRGLVERRLSLQGEGQPTPAQNRRRRLSATAARQDAPLTATAASAPSPHGPAVRRSRNRPDP